jgi:hypothetical protein
VCLATQHWRPNRLGLLTSRGVKNAKDSPSGRGYKLSPRKIASDSIYLLEMATNLPSSLAFFMKYAG